MKKILIIIGDWVPNFLNNVRFFQYLEKNLKCKIKKKDDFKFYTKINHTEITFQFCFGPLNDTIWKERKELKLKEGKNLPPSVEEFFNSYKDYNECYYIGFCGVLKGKINRIYLPNKFIRAIFKKYILDKLSIKELEISEELYSKNKFIGKIPGLQCTAITSNQVLSLNYTKENSKEILKEISKNFSNHAEVVEMENYEIAKRAGEKYNGAVLYAGDSPSKKKHMLGQKKNKDEKFEKFNKAGLEMLKLII